MREQRPNVALSVFGLLLMAFMSACGGGGSESSPGPPNPPPPPPSALTITDNSILPGALQSFPYTISLHASNGVGALNWSIAPISSTALFVDGLTIDASTGVLSGTVNFQGTGGFIATVTDSATPPRTANKGFSITAGGPLQSPPPQTLTETQYDDIQAISFGSPGGVQPLTFTITSGSLPSGLRLNNQLGVILGSPITIGTFAATVTIQDSFTPAEVVSTNLTVNVTAPALALTPSLPTNLLLNRPFAGKVIAHGGLPPYKFSVSSGSLPPGLNSIDPNGGQISGTPTALGSFDFGINVSDSSPIPQNAAITFFMTVSNPIGRNDTVATATSIGNGTFNASISPYIDPPETPAAADNDYYRLVSLGGAIVHVETQAERLYDDNPLDTVIEIVDGNGLRQGTCRQPGDNSNNFSSACINDDISTDPPLKDSALDFRVPGAANVAATFYVHVLDWRGDARPDMLYALQVSGVVTPLSVQTLSLSPAARGLPYSQQLVASNGIGTVSWTLASGSLPPGLMLSSSGLISGTPTLDGGHSFSVAATDSDTPPQKANAQEAIQVVEPVKITSPATWPDACVNKAYSLTIQTSGGAAPLQWSFISNNWVGINLNQATGTFSGRSSVTGTFTGTVGVLDATGQSDSQVVTLTVKQCT